MYISLKSWIEASLKVLVTSTLVVGLVALTVYFPWTLFVFLGVVLAFSFGMIILTLAEDIEDRKIER